MDRILELEAQVQQKQLGSTLSIVSNASTVVSTSAFPTTKPIKLDIEVLTKAFDEPLVLGERQVPRQNDSAKHGNVPPTLGIRSRVSFSSLNPALPSESPARPSKRVKHNPAELVPPLPSTSGPISRNPSGQASKPKNSRPSRAKPSQQLQREDSTNSSKLPSNLNPTPSKPPTAFPLSAVVLDPTSTVPSPRITIDPPTSGGVLPPQSLSSNVSRNTASQSRGANPDASHIQRTTKPKRLRAANVSTKTFNIPKVPRDLATGLPLLPLTVGIMTVISLGQICDREHFHTERYIFPVGYEVTRYVSFYQCWYSSQLNSIWQTLLFHKRPSH